MNSSKQPVTLHVAEIKCALGELVLVHSLKGLCYLDFGSWTDLHFQVRQWSKRWFHVEHFDFDELPFAHIRIQINQYLHGAREQFDIALDMRGTPFQLRVWQTLRDISYGATVCYSHIAKSIELPRAVRAVGGANNSNPLPIIIPCHRVLGKQGALVGYRGGIEKKQQLLDIEKQRINCHLK
jgi:O-6-methylguanine DNA methyltransferase